MKKLISALAAAALFATLLAGCGSGASSSASASSEAASSTASEAASTDASSTEEATASVDLGAIVTAIEAVNEVPNARAIDDFSMENEMNLTPDNIVAFQGDVTNDQADCALVFAAQVKDGTADAVKAELEAYKESMSSTLYADFADKVAKARIIPQSTPPLTGHLPDSTNRYQTGRAPTGCGLVFFGGLFPTLPEPREEEPL